MSVIYHALTDVSFVHVSNVWVCVAGMIGGWYVGYGVGVYVCARVWVSV